MLAGDVDECLSERWRGPTKVEQSRHVEFTKSKFSGAGNFRTAPSQQKGVEQRVVYSIYYICTLVLPYGRGEKDLL